MKTRTATYLPRLAVGANSEVAARAVNSLMPAPIPANVMPPAAPVNILFAYNEREDEQMKIFME